MVQEAIDSASFLSIDGEFTGINAYRQILNFFFGFRYFEDFCITVFGFHNVLFD